MFSSSFRTYVLAAVALGAASLQLAAAGKAGTMEIVGNSGVSAQMVSALRQTPLPPSNHS